MVLQNRDIVLMAGVGLSLGLALTVLDTAVFAPSDGPEYSDAGRDRYVTEQAALEAEFGMKLEELRQLENVPASPAQQWAEGVLASGEPLTVREMTTLSQIVDGGAGDYSRYSGSSYVGGAASAQPPTVTTPQGGVSSRPVAGLLSASGSRSYGPASADLIDGSSINNAGTIDVRTGQYYAPAGTGYVNPHDGTYYAPSGPSGVVDTRTGSFIPTAP